jgi:hypothetical protein
MNAADRQAEAIDALAQNLQNAISRGDVDQVARLAYALGAVAGHGHGEIFWRGPAERDLAGRRRAAREANREGERRAEERRKAEFAWRKMNATLDQSDPRTDRARTIALRLGLKSPRPVYDYLSTLERKTSK